jgi:mannan endo-1,4-beta-mannosidase
MTKIPFLIFPLLFSVFCLGQKPVSPNASKEAEELLSYLYSLSGKYTLTGQHCQPLYKDILLERIHDVTGEYPVLYGQDFGFSEPNSLDGINFRQRIVDDAIVWHKKGAIITIMWHAVPPTMEEPVSFKDGIQSKINDDEWQQLVTEGTPINNRWKSQVDVIAFFLKQLRNQRIPILWRPYHEMNGRWFWWGNKPGPDGYQKLYKMLFDRLTNYHGINNLIWVFNGNEINPPGVKTYDKFYPGNNYVDILATDVYHNNYALRDYNSLQELADGKPVALGEVGHMPSVKQLEEQPNWLWFMTWANFVFENNTEEERQQIYHADKTLTLGEIFSEKSGAIVH